MEKQGQGYSGLTAWLADIEVNKIAYIGSIITLILGIVMVYQPLFEIVTPYTGAIPLSTAEFGIINTVQIGVLVLNVVSIAAILFPLLKFFEWKYHWFAIAFAASLIECVAAGIILSQKEKLVENALVNFALELLSAEVNLTANGCILIATFMLSLLSAGKMIFDIWKNREKYAFG